MHAFFLALLSAFLLAGCAPFFTDGKMMTFPSYQEVALGQTVSELTEKYGTPYERRTLSNHKVEYVYIEHVFVGRRDALMREYVFTIEDDKVIQKNMTETKSSQVHFSSD